MNETTAQAYARGRKAAVEVAGMPPFQLADFVRAARYYAAVASYRSTRAYWLGVIRELRVTGGRP